MNNGSFWLPPPVSTVASDVDSLFYFILWWSVVFFIGVVGAMLFFAIRYRRTDRDEYPPVVRESRWLEALWVIGPTILVVIVFYSGFASFVRLNTPPPDAYQIQVTGQQWSWNFEYPNGVVSTNEMYVPVDRPVELRMSSQDVIHSFFVPAFRTKNDVLPNRYTTIWFEATEEGQYDAFCTEYCGTDHSGMTAQVHAVDQTEFEDWLEKQASAGEDMPLEEYGEQLYEEQGCNACHSLDGSSSVGPSFQGVFGSTSTLQDGSTVEVDENYLRESIIEPNAQVVQGFQPAMPPFAHLNERQVSALIEFIKTVE
jgi:cytochrome c oxidase subunit 2